MPRSYYFNDKGNLSALKSELTFEADVIVVEQADVISIFSDKNAFALLFKKLDENQVDLYVKIDCFNHHQFKKDLKLMEGKWIKGWVIPHASTHTLNQMVMAVRDFEQNQHLDFGSLSFIAIIDCPEGVISYRKIAKYERVKALYFDEEKYREFLGWKKEGTIDFAFNQVAFASAISKKPLIDRIYYQDELLKEDLKKGKNFGCLAKATNKNTQIEEINAFYTPSEEELKESLHVLNQYWDTTKKNRRHFIIDGKEVSDFQIYHCQEIILNSPQFRENPFVGSLTIKGEKVLVSQRISSTKKFYTIGEEIGNAITHGFGILLALASLIILLFKGMKTGNQLDFWAYFIYGCSAILLFTASTLYHGFPLGGKAKKLFQKFDHMTIYLLIAGTYTPYTLIAIGGRLGVVLCSLMWGCSLIGLLMNVFWFGKFKVFHLVLYVGLGWMAFFYLNTIIIKIGLMGTILLLAGGVAYTIGIIFYALKLFKFTHMVWHFLVILGFILHFLSIYFYV
ncbi:MAG: hemolysin III family protein [Bacilli bacterium]